MDAEAVAGEFVSMLANPALMGGFMVIVVLLCFGVCAMGLQKGVERIYKGHDGVSAGADGGAGRTFHGSAGRRSRSGVLPEA